MLKSLPHITSRLKFRQLTLLVALEEHGSLHRAAQALGITQPGLTKALREIEGTFGMALFARSSKGVVPNELGRCVLRYARQIDADLDHMREAIDGVLRGGGGRLAVGAITGAFHSLLIGALAELRNAQPALSTEVREGTSFELLNLVNAGRLDLAICRTTVAPQPEQFDYEPLLEEKVGVVVGPAHPLANARKVTLKQLAKFRWICYPAGMPLRSLMEREFREAGLPLPAYPTETSSSFATMLMLQEDPQMVAMMSAATIAFCERHGIAVRLPLAVRSRHESYGIVTRRGATLSSAASLLVERLRLLAARSDDQLPAVQRR